MAEPSAPASLPPIALFAYKRPQHLLRTLQALAANPEARFSTLHIFCDGPRTETDAPAVAQVRAVAQAVQGFAHVEVHARERNAGLARSIIEGVGCMLQAHERVIVVEDDLVVSPHFLRYMHEALALYAADEQVASIHGYGYPIGPALPDTYFLRGADCWGWATWARAWRHFEPDGALLLQRLRAQRLTHAFDLDGAIAYTRMLEDQIAGRNDSWAIRWHASAFLRGMLTLHPGRSLVDNIGHDDSGTHSGVTDVYRHSGLARTPARLTRLPLTEDTQARAHIVRFLRQTHGRAPSWRHRVRHALHSRSAIFRGPFVKNLLRQCLPPIVVDAARRLRQRPQPRAGGDIELAYDGFSIRLPAEHMLPVYRERYPLYDAFLPVLAAHLPAGSGVIDIGANCGDTLAGMVARNAGLHYLCIEPDDAFYAYLEANTERMRAHHPALRVDKVRSLIGQAVDHVALQGVGGTKHAVAGAGGVRSTPLDALLREQPLPTLALLKSDVDGFDHDVIVSAQATLRAQQPLVFFECQFDAIAQMQAYEHAIAGLREMGYTDWAVFDNFGALMLRSGDADAVPQLMHYVMRQNTGRAARTVYYLDLLAAMPHHQPLVDRALQEYLSP